VKQILSENKKERLPDKLEDFAQTTEKKIEADNGIGQDDLTRFDHL